MMMVMLLLLPAPAACSTSFIVEPRPALLGAVIVAFLRSLGWDRLPSIVVMLFFFHHSSQPHDRVVTSPDGDTSPGGRNGGRLCLSWRCNRICTAMVRRNRRVYGRDLTRGRWRLSLVFGRFSRRLGRGAHIPRRQGILCNVGINIATWLSTCRCRRCRRLLLFGLFLLFLLGLGWCSLASAVISAGAATLGWTAANLLITTAENGDGLHLLLDIAERGCDGSIPPSRSFGRL
mmetsp:Transcript_32116/g.94524  ORF Transcript_32116/g.94524 Transcript_32116/m.94524 type:complete len:233 (-) Transcript_32116:1515-2213(-)